jgi:hypothetical protein
MAGSQLATQVTVFPFTYRVEGDEAIIANASQTAFLAIPRPALDLLTDLAAGRSTGEAQAAFALKYGETPDVDDFLEVLAAEGFIATDAHQVLEPANSSDNIVQSAPAQSRRYHFESIREPTARRLVSQPVLGGCGLLIAFALLAIALDPALFPPPTVLVFTHDLTLFSVIATIFVLGTIFLHELAHLIAARAAGVPARLGVSHRLWFLVAETDLTGVWLASPGQRYLAFLAGPLLDATSGALLILVLWTNRQLVWLPPLAVELIRVFLFTYIVRLLWQCYFFLRTDFYYVFATFFRCKNLLEDTQNWLGNQLARVVTRFPIVDQSAIPARERRVIRAYSIVWLAGRALAFASLILITLPILWGYGRELAQLFFGGSGNLYVLADAFIWTMLTLATPVGGLFLWLRQLYRSTYRLRRVIG